MKHKNDYSVIAYFDTCRPKKWVYVHALDGFVDFLNKKHSTWKYFNVYNRRTGQYLQRIYKTSAIPKYL